MKKLTLLLLAMVCLTPLHAKKTLLEINLNKGDTFKHTSTMEMNMSQSIMGMNIDAISEVFFEMSTNVLEVTENGYLVSMTFDKLQLNMDAAGINFFVTSDNLNDADPVSVLVNLFIGKEFKAVINKRGAIAEFIGLDKLYNDILYDLRNSEVARTTPHLEHIMSQYMSEDNLTRNFGFGKGFSYPDEPVKKGYKWTQSSNFTDPSVSLDMTTEYTFMGKKKGYWIIEANSIITVSPDVPLNEIGGEKVTMKLNGTMTTTMKMDPATGWTKESSGIQNIEGSVGVSAMEIPLTMKSKVNVKVN